MVETPLGLILGLPKRKKKLAEERKVPLIAELVKYVLPVEQGRRLVFCDDDAHLLEAVDDFVDTDLSVLVLVQLGEDDVQLLLVLLQVRHELLHVQVARVAHVGPA